jgi:hypothetical protein
MANMTELVSSEERIVRLKFDGPSVQDGRVPLLTLADKLLHLQKTLFNIAASTFPKPGRRGNWSSKVQRACELRFLDIKRSSLEIVSELPPAEEFETDGLDLGVGSLRILRNVLASISEKNYDRVVGIFPDSGTRARIMKSVIGLLPNEDDDYTIMIGMNSSQAGWVLRAEDREFVNAATVEVVDEADEESIRTITGKLFRIEVDTAERHVALEVSGRRIKCRYPDYLEQTISQFVAGSLVEVKGKATFDSGGNVQEIKEIIEVDEIELRPVAMKRVKENGRSLILKDAISVSLDYRNGVWVYEYDPLGILAYASTRRLALRNLREEFFFLWDDLRTSADGDLTLDAQELKKRVTDLIQEDN